MYSDIICLLIYCKKSLIESLCGFYLYFFLLFLKKKKKGSFGSFEVLFFFFLFFPPQTKNPLSYVCVSYWLVNAWVFSSSSPFKRPTRWKRPDSASSRRPGTAECFPPSWWLLCDFGFIPSQRLNGGKQSELPVHVSVPSPRRVSCVLVPTLAQAWAAGRHGEARQQVRGGPGCSSTVVRWPVLSGDNHQGKGKEKLLAVGSFSSVRVTQTVF